MSRATTTKNDARAGALLMAGTLPATAVDTAGHSVYYQEQIVTARVVYVPGYHVGYSRNHRPPLHCCHVLLLCVTGYGSVDVSVLSASNASIVVHHYS